ncbi:hypothetical protein MPF_0034 [Methanohalophilus portucalensis FDF-1]|uniref:Uncharacterized protein n=1 Tax=Methanohalophilus portucalensis FDF-1 TaxID=523843 RepID=A0A1L9C6Y7_9EURY|nr:hypothetical protein MPF_0034 [Methanohalophilus portucalensis FDF-1]
MYKYIKIQKYYLRQSNIQSGKMIIVRFALSEKIII